MFCWKCGSKNEETAFNCIACDSILASVSELASKREPLFEESNRVALSTADLKVEFKSDSRGRQEVTVEDESGTHTYPSIDEAPPKVRAIIEQLKKESGLSFTDWESSLEKYQSTREVPDLVSAPRTFNDADSTHPSAEVKSSSWWTVLLAIGVGIIAFLISRQF
jgi:hypothetical protein